MPSLQSSLSIKAPVYQVELQIGGWKGTTNFTGGGSQSGSFPFILNDKCHYPPGPHWVWRSDVTTVRKSRVLVRHDSEEEIDPAFREVRERNG